MPKEEKCQETEDTNILEQQKIYLAFESCLNKSFRHRLEKPELN